MCDVLIHVCWFCGPHQVWRHVVVVPANDQRMWYDTSLYCHKKEFINDDTPGNLQRSVDDQHRSPGPPPPRLEGWRDAAFSGRGLRRAGRWGSWASSSSWGRGRAAGRAPPPTPCWGSAPPPRRCCCSAPPRAPPRRPRGRAAAARGAAAGRSAERGTAWDRSLQQAASEWRHCSTAALQPTYRYLASSATSS